MTDQGGPDQGIRQLSIYNDYNNADHNDPVRFIRAFVFRNRDLTADDLGRTITFSVDAKRGNINDPTDPTCPCDSKAALFIKVLDQLSGQFFLLGEDQVDMTNISTDWGRYSVSIDILDDQALVGQLLQIGFSSDAGSFQPSGIIYDNLEVSSSRTVPAP